jgi:hypothetical protein
MPGGAVFCETVCKSQASCASSYGNKVVCSMLSRNAEVVVSNDLLLVFALACGAAPVKLMPAVINRVNFILQRRVGMVSHLRHALDVECSKAYHIDVRIVLWSGTVPPTVEFSRVLMRTSWR